MISDDPSSFEKIRNVQKKLNKSIFDEDINKEVIILAYMNSEVP